MDDWIYYDSKGRSVALPRAAFACREVVVAADLPAVSELGSLDSLEYHDAHSLAKASDRRTFKSKVEMLRWFADVTAAGPDLGD